MWKALSIGAVTLGIGVPALVGSGRADLDERVAVGPGGSVGGDLELAGGFAYEHGSLEIRSHDADDVRVQADSSGWGNDP